MQLEECFLEMVCHARWVLNFCISRLKPETREVYSSDIAQLQEGLNSISQPHSSDAEVLDIPAHVVEALCRGVGYLLLGEDVLGKAPATMHPFLRQTANNRKESAKQAQVIVVRWFTNAGLVSIEELLGVIYGPEASIENYESDYDAHMAVALSLSSEEPFYLGAHVTILRALLLNYCTTVFTAEDIISHVTKINPSAGASLYTLEDTLLHWMRTVMSLVPSNNLTSDLTDSLTDLYVNTNDGRALALVIHYYRPDLLPLDAIHLEGHGDSEDDSGPLARWQREDNWSAVIRVAEELGLWVGVFSEEIVSHGFSTLQLHVLRVAEELFAILAVGAEEQMDEILQGAQCGQIDPSPKDHSGVSVELDADSSLVMVNTSARAESEGEAFDVASFTSQAITSALAGRSEISKSLHQDNIPSPVDDDDPLASQRRGGYNIVLTNMFLQGIAMPVASRAAQQPTMVTEGPTFSTTKKGFNHDDSLRHSLQETQDLSAFVVKSSRDGRQVVQVEVKSEIVPSAYAPVVDDGPEMVVGTSPHKSEASRPNTRPFDSRNGAIDDIPAINRSVQKINGKPIVSMSTGKSLTSLHGPSVVQGSVHQDGIAELIAELRAGCELTSPAAVYASTETTNQVKEQNKELRSALKRQQRLMETFLQKVQQCLSSPTTLKAAIGQLSAQAPPAAAGMSKSIAVGTSFSQSGHASPQKRKIPSVSVGDGVGSQTVPLPALLSVSKLQASQSTDNGELQNRLPKVKSLGPLVNPPRPVLPSVMDISIDALQANPSKGKAIPQRLADRLSAAAKSTSEPKAHKIGQPAPEALSAAPQPECLLPEIPRRKSEVPATKAPTIRTWNNRNNVTLALRLALLPGEMNKAALESIIGIMDRVESDFAESNAGGSLQFVVLLKDEFAHAFKALYVLKNDGMLTRLYGAGPAYAYVGTPLTTDSAKLFPKFFKYDTTGKKFILMPHKEANQTTDAVSFAKVANKVKAKPV